MSYIFTSCKFVLHFYVYIFTFCILVRHFRVLYFSASVGVTSPSAFYLTVFYF